MKNKMKGSRVTRGSNQGNFASSPKLMANISKDKFDELVEHNRKIEAKRTNSLIMRAKLSNASKRKRNKKS